MRVLYIPWLLFEVDTIIIPCWYEGNFRHEGSCMVYKVEWNEKQAYHEMFAPNLCQEKMFTVVIMYTQVVYINNYYQSNLYYNLVWVFFVKYLMFKYKAYAWHPRSLVEIKSEPCWGTATYIWIWVPTMIILFMWNLMIIGLIATTPIFALDPPLCWWV